jgi:hypothetical protein
MGRRDELQARFKQIQEKASTPMSQSDRNVEIAIGVLGEAVVRLEKSSTFLAWVNIALTGVILAVGIVQICLMLRGH